ncbi:TetR/AcrR family transcriptional regulator [Labrenzia sp. CE80]|uniref:TetR/AcrR family transcriptional regulator n=1 Tax=Labrenzia sp. CE80 TaxID=1788986 RepID=UPI00257082F4|nr:TetR/AcrR family transcriptional regulator [Labrenzia sp. CE80]
MVSETTAQRILRNAEYLMASNGIASTSVRQITDASEANVASVNYYFGSKTELLLELLKDRFSQLDTELLTRVNAVEKNAAGAGPKARDLTAAYFDALAYLGFNSETGQLDPFILLIQRAAAEQEEILEKAQDFSAPGLSKLMSLLADSIPGNQGQDIEIKTLLRLMFTTSVAAMPTMNAERKNDMQFSAVRDFLFAGVEAYLLRIAGKP